ncbi:putative serine/threonine-protein kinase RIO1 like protein [Nosema granulosis]|uniref:non-specific serine/threonine protein kinase n=1 Tax=Nosema granulosis TaxID=83296 RepID=A0A9P6H192_9MICR|nr:putative serine/threonine-protein kinase RIO1 like protein [Nosema granulosis]
MKPCKVEKTRKDKSDRATVDKVLDKKTLAILEKLIKRGKLFDLGGSICTGKEANVYLANSSTALYSKYVNNIHVLDEKESKNVFNMKNFQKFLNKKTDIKDGNIVESMKEHFEQEKNVSKPEEIETEANEEEIIPVAIKIYKTSTMLFKDRERYIESEQRFKRFCTSNSRKLVKLWAEKEVRNLKRLNKADIPSPIPIYLKRNVLIMTLLGEENNIAPRLKDADMHDIEDCYNQCINIMNEMYNKAGLVHSDFSEYNLLYKDKVVYVIDVGQSVEISHINSNYFLIIDITNINSFFKKIGFSVRNVNEIFEEITKKRIPEYLRGTDVTKNTFIPTNLSEISNIEDMEMFKNGPREIEEQDSSNTSDSSSEENEETKKDDDQPRLVDNLDKKERKRLTKEFNKIRRLSRISKKEKHRIFKKYKGKKK